MILGRNVIHEAGKKAIIYLRVSTEEQVDNFSLDTQEDICRKEAERRGYEVVEIFREEGRSAKTIVGRPILIQMLEYCRKNKRKVQAVFVYRIDRISRQTADYLGIRKKLAESDVAVVSATEPTGDSPTEKLVETILAGFAQLDNDIRSERARNGLRARFNKGLISGKPPLGYIFQSGYAVKDPKTWDLMKKAWELMATGSKSLSEIGKVMTDWGLRETHGKKIHIIRPQTANAIFRLKFYAGYLNSKTYKEEVRGQHVPMITEEQFYKVQAILDGRKQNQVTKRDHRFNIDFPLRRIVKCGNCGAGFTGAWTTSGHGKKFPYYWCSKRCIYKSIPIADVEYALINLLKELTPKKENLEYFLDTIQRTYHERLSRLNKIRNEADAEIESLKALRKTIVEKNLAGVYSDEIFKEQNAAIEDRIARALVVKEDNTLKDYNIDALLNFIKTILADLGETYKRASLGQIKVILGAIFPDGLTWDYTGTLHPKISPLYQAICHIGPKGIRSGAGDGMRARDLFLGKEAFYC